MRVYVQRNGVLMAVLLERLKPGEIMRGLVPKRLRVALGDDLPRASASIRSALRGDMSVSGPISLRGAVVAAVIK